MGRPKVVFYYQAGCPACAGVKPHVERLAQHYGACVDTEWRDVEEHAEEAERWGVEAVPDIVSFDGEGRPLFRLTGYVESIQRCNRIYVATIKAAADSCSVDAFRP